MSATDRQSAVQVRSFSFICDRIFEGENSTDSFGRAVAIGGDADGDGYKDALIGAFRFPGKNPAQGRAYLYYGADKVNMDTECDITFSCPEPGYSQFGVSVDTFDIDDDGHAEVLIGARFACDFRGQIYLYFFYLRYVI
ncbi:MAG: FG-GAP repeat protein [Phycisphaerales bacterium]|nr:MAG: FG-GAP repeat protein [Phycisphaerales bacterium]